MPCCRELVFEWNGTDTSQFESTPGYTSGSGDGQLVVTASADHGTVLRISGTAGKAITFLANDAISFSDDRRDLCFEVEVLDGAYNAGVTFGVVILADATGNRHQLEHHIAGWTWSSARVDDGNMTLGDFGGSNQGIYLDGGFCQIDMRGFKTAGSPPGITSVFQAWDDIAEDSFPIRTGNDNGGFPSFTQTPSALPASWNDLTCNRWGISLLTPTINDLINAYTDILNLRVWKII